MAFKSASSCCSMTSRRAGTVIAAPGTAATVSMAFARIARCPLSASDDLEPDHAAEGGGRVLGEPLAVGLRKLVEPGRHDRQSERPAVRLAGSKQGHVELVPQRLPRRGAGRVVERTVPGGRVGVPAQVAFAVERGRRARRGRAIVRSGSAPPSSCRCPSRRGTPHVARTRSARRSPGPA